MAEGTVKPKEVKISTHSQCMTVEEHFETICTPYVHICIYIFIFVFCVGGFG